MPKWIIDSDHSVAAFVIRHMMIANVRGQFNRVSGFIDFDPANVLSSSVEAHIEASGIYTGIPKRDEHLRSVDFFDVAKFPTIDFKGNAVTRGGDGELQVAGELTLHGVSKNISLRAEYSHIEKSPFDETSVGFHAETEINREDFGLKWNVALESGGLMVGKEVKIMLDIEADLATE